MREFMHLQPNHAVLVQEYGNVKIFVLIKMPS